MHGVDQAEDALLRSLASAWEDAAPTPIFILGAPRTGSTLLYQALCSRFGFPYIANLTNDHFSRTPIVGLAIQKAMPTVVEFSSHYGKTTGLTQTSEGSAVLSRWFGGGHPSAVVSNRIIAGEEAHFLKTLVAVEALYGLPLVLKNPWNCFRIRYLAETLTSARFVWICRDLADAAKSDLAARYKTKATAYAWNSATPANVEKLKLLPPVVQVIENQYEFNVALGNGLQQFAAGRWRRIWHEDFRANPDNVLTELGDFLSVSSTENAPPVEIKAARDLGLTLEDEAGIESYVQDHEGRLRPYGHHLRHANHKSVSTGEPNVEGINESG